MRNLLIICSLLLVVSLFASCRNEEKIVYSEQEQVYTPQEADPADNVVGLYLLNSGVKGNNEATLDYFDYATGIYHRNIYAERNPKGIPNLGDNGVDILVGGERLYVTLNGSHRLEIFNVRTTQKVGSVAVNAPRRLLFHDKYIYVTSYLKQKTLQYGQLPLGELVRVNVDDYSDVQHITLGCQPDQMTVVKTKKNSGDVETLLLVSNTGEFHSPAFDNRISVVALENFVQTAFIQTATAPNDIAMNSFDYLYVATRGNRRDEAPKLCILKDKNSLNSFATDATREIPILAFVQLDDTLFMLQGRKNQFGEILERDFVKYSTKSNEIVQRFVTDGSEDQIENPTSIAVHPKTHDIYVTDARRGTSSGMLYCYAPDGRQKWKVKTGIKPCKVAFVYK